jgi:Tfp pilus assembly protein PilV
MRIQQTVPWRRRQASAGLSLFEVCVGMGILGIIIVSMYAIVSSGYGIVQLERENIRATQILVEKMDALRLYTWDQLEDKSFIPSKFTATFNPTNDTNPNIVAIGVKPTGGKTVEVIYNGTIKIDDGPADVTYGTDMKTVTVAVSWKSGAVGNTRTRQFTTYVTKNGLQNYIY